MPNWCDNSIVILAKKEINDEIKENVDAYLGRRAEDANVYERSIPSEKGEQIWSRIFIHVRTGYGPPAEFINHVLKTYPNVLLNGHYWIEGGLGAADFEMSSDDAGHVEYHSHEAINQDYITEEEIEDMIEETTLDEVEFDTCRLFNPTFERLVDMGYTIHKMEDYQQLSNLYSWNVLEARDNLIQYIGNLGPWQICRCIDFLLRWIQTQKSIDQTASDTYDWFTALRQYLSRNHQYKQMKTLLKAPEWKTFAKHWSSPTFQQAVRLLTKMKYSKNEDHTLEYLFHQMKNALKVVTQQGELDLNILREKRDLQIGRKTFLPMLYPNEKEAAAIREFVNARDALEKRIQQSKQKVLEQFILNAENFI